MRAVAIARVVAAGALGAGAALAFAPIAPLLPAALAQDPPAAGAPAESELDRMLRVAREGSPVVRPQAARRFAALGAPAAARVLALTGGEPRGYAALGQDLIEVLGELPDDALRADLWEALGDPGFPWRPSAARTLARTAREAERARLAALLADPVGPVRVAAIEGLAALGADAQRAELRARLSDPDDRVRRAAAVALDRCGERAALWYLVEDLKRVDRYFEIDTGKAARFEAARMLGERLGAELGFAPERAPDAPENAAARARIEERVRALAGDPPELPRVARAAPAQDARPALGLELRSCRRGELFLAFTADDVLWVGTGHPRRLALAPGTTARLAERARAVARTLGPDALLGTPGCDLEVYRVVAADGAEDAGSAERADGGLAHVRLSKGPEPVAGLRPDALAALAREILASVPEADLRADLALALEAVGGPLAPADGR